MAIGNDITYSQSTVGTTTRALYTTLRKHIREIEVEVLRNHQLLAMLDSDGKLSMNNGGAGFDWPVQYRIHDMQDQTGTEARNFVAQDLWRLANLDYRSYIATDAISKREKLEAQGVEGIIKVGEKLASRLKMSMRENFVRELYVDGMASGNSNRLCGIETMMGEKRAAGPISQSINISTSGSSLASRDANVLDPFMWPDDTYAGLDTDLGYYGGACLTDTWPAGTADAQFDFWSPVLVNSNSSFFGASPNWATYAKDILSLGIIRAHRNAPPDQQMNMVLMDSTLYYQARSLLTNDERIIVSNKAGLKSFGFKNVFEIDGVEVTWEYGVPATTTYRTSNVATVVPTAYGFSTGNMLLRSCQSTLFDLDGPEYDINSQHDKVAVDFFGNMQFDSPRRFVKWAAYSATS